MQHKYFSQHKLYQATEHSVSTSCCSLIPNEIITLEDPRLSKLIQIIDEEYYTHPKGEYLGTKKQLKFDIHYRTSKLIRNVRKINYHGYAIQKAIDLASIKTGRVVLKGSHTSDKPIIYYTGALELKSGVELHIEKGAILKFIRNKNNQYYPLVLTRFEGVELINFSPLIYSNNAKNISITGDGTLDGCADEYNWMPWKFGFFGEDNQETQRQQLFSLGQQNTDVYSERLFDDKISTLRPPFIQFYNSKNILLKDFTLVNSPFWCINPVLCSNILAQNLNIQSNLYNNDGFDPESCCNVIIENCNFMTGDDCIAIKSGRNNDGRRINIPSQNIIIRNNKFCDGHGGITIGSEISGGVKNIFAHNNYFDSPELDYPIRFKTNAERGGELENIYIFDSLVNKSKIAVIHADFYYEEGLNGNHLPRLHNVIINNLYTINNGSIDAKYPLYMRGFDNAPIENIILSNIRLFGIKGESCLENIRNLSLHEIYINGNKIPNQIINI